MQQALRLKKIGNELVTLLGGREIHPINVTRRRLLPRADAARAARRSPSGSKRALGRARSRLSRLVAGFEFPDFEQDYEFVALRHPDEYPFNEGRLVSNQGLDIAVAEYEEHFIEEHVAALERPALACCKGARRLPRRARWRATT